MRRNDGVDCQLVEFLAGKRGCDPIGRCEAESYKLLVLQTDHRVDARRAQRWDEAGKD